MTAPPTALVALGARRDAALQLLTDSFAAELLTIEEFDERATRAHAATTVAELDALVADLAPAPAATSALVPLAVDVSLDAPARSFTSVFGNIERRGAWIVPAQLSATAVFASVVLDLREARLSAALTELQVRVVFGNLEVIVPPHLAVECEGSSFFGNVESQAAAADPDRPRLRVRGTAVFGNIEVHTRLPGESERDARRRRKDERRRLAEARRAALPARQPK